MFGPRVLGILFGWCQFRPGPAHPDGRCIGGGPCTRDWCGTRRGDSGVAGSRRHVVRAQPGRHQPRTGRVRRSGRCGARGCRVGGGVGAIGDMTTYWCEYAWLDDGVFEGVRLDVADGSITTVEIGAPREGTILWGLTVPGFANAHSHVFHRALRGRTHGERGTFWTWRERMYRLAAVLDPDTYYRLARAVYAEMVLAGYTSVGEFHYLHHAPGGVRYNDPNVMSAALDAAATEAGIRLCLLDTCYLSSGFGAAVGEQQARFADADVHGWAGRAAAFRPHGELVRTGVAAHSVRAVPPEALPVIRARAATGPLHVHLSEQRDENEQCRRVYGRSPTEVLHDGGVLGERTVAVHATHLGERDVGLLGSTGTGVCCCPTTERDLGDGIGPAQALASSGAALSLGSDSHAVIDPVEESRALEMHERLA